MQVRSRKNRLSWILATLVVVAGLIASLFLPRGPRIEIMAKDRSGNGKAPRPGALFQGDGDPVVTFAEDAFTTGNVTTAAEGGPATAGPIESIATVLGETGRTPSIPGLAVRRVRKG